MNLHRAHHIADSASYTDLNRLNQLKVGEGRDSAENIRKVAQEFEALFISEMMKAMRSANDVLADDLFNSNESKTYRDMYDQQMAVTLSSGRGIGMADVLVKQMTDMGKAAKRSNPFPDMQPTKAETEQQMPRELSPLRRTSMLAPTKAPARLEQKAAVNPAAQQYQAVAAQQTTEVPTNKTTFASPMEFINSMLPMARNAAAKLGIDAGYLVAQAALETGWCKYLPRDAQGNHTFNLFGIKAHGWSGQSVTASTSEFVNGKKVTEQADFRKYDSFAQSFNDYVQFLQRNGRYAKALQVADKPEQFIQELQRAGYATDPSYADKISRIAKQMQNIEHLTTAPTQRIAEQG